MIDQLTVFLQNEPGRLRELTGVLSENDINISALSMAETEEYGIIRMIVSDSEKAEKALKAKHFIVKIVDVIGITIPDVPGKLHHVLELLADEGINVSYMYGYSDNGSARMILKVSDPVKAGEILKKMNLQ